MSLLSMLVSSHSPPITIITINSTRKFNQGTSRPPRTYKGSRVLHRRRSAAGKIWQILGVVKQTGTPFETTYENDAEDEHPTNSTIASIFLLIECVD
jgi:hypothetical protein